MNRRSFLRPGSLAAFGAAATHSLGRVLPAWPAARAASQRARLTVVCNEQTGRISRNVYGNFAEHLGSCVYDAMWVGTESPIPNDDGLRKDTTAALKRIHSPMIRWPGGCFADSYHWRDGIGPRAKRPKTWNIWWDRDESNAFGTDEFLKYAALCGAEPYICVNVGSGSPREAFEWMEYCIGNQPTSLSELRAANGHQEPYRVGYWAVGNENWGCGGNFDPEDYARHYARFVTYLSKVPHDGPVEFVACGDTHGNWNQKLFETLLNRPYSRGRLRDIQHLSIHHYFKGGPAVEFRDEDYYGLLASLQVLENQIRETIGIIDYYPHEGDRPIGIALDEWGVWHPGDPSKGPKALWQPNTLRDALLAAVVLNSLNQYGERVSMANIAQTFNVLQCLAFTEGPRMVLTPTYYVFDPFQPHMGAMGLRTLVDSPTFTAKLRRGEATRPSLSASASRDESSGMISLTLVNQHLSEPLEVEIHLADLDHRGGESTSVQGLTASSVRDQNTFEKPDVVRPQAGKPISFSGNSFVQVVPAHSVQALVLKSS